MANLDTSNPFQSFLLTEQEEEMAVAVTPYTLMYLQNKLAAYAINTLSEGEDDAMSPDPVKQFDFVSNQIKRRAQIAMLKEIINEFTDGANAALARQTAAATAKEN